MFGETTCATGNQHLIRGPPLMWREGGTRLSSEEHNFTSLSFSPTALLHFPHLLCASRSLLDFLPFFWKKQSCHHFIISLPWSQDEARKRNNASSSRRLGAQIGPRNARRGNDGPKLLMQARHRSCGMSAYCELRMGEILSNPGPPDSDSLHVCTGNYLRFSLLSSSSGAYLTSPAH